MEAKDNANVIANSFASKYALPSSVPGQKHLVETIVAVQMPELILIRSHVLVGILKVVKVDIASGSLGLPARVYCDCNKELGRQSLCWCNVFLFLVSGIKSSDSIKSKRCTRTVSVP